jgi:pyruvate dehydrogenase E1 component alpha subunit
MSDQATESAEDSAEPISLNDDIADDVRGDLSDDELVELYEQMVLIRRFEEHAGRAYQMKKIKGFCHLYTGQEACATGGIAAVRDDDYVMTAYRDHGHALARGLEPNEVMAELHGKAAGYTDGKCGSMHLFDVDKHFYGGWAIVGGHIPLAAGMAFAIDYRDEDRVCLCYFGEGAIHQGVFHEAANMASKWDLPVVYVVEDNDYAMGTALDRVSAVTDLTKKAVSYDMDAYAADGQDLFDVYNTIDEAVTGARNGEGPALVHLDTYRYRGHSMTDPATYRDRDELEQEQQRDPIQRFSNWLIDEDICTQDQLTNIDESAQNQVDEAVEFAEEADFPDESELETDV